MVTRIAAMLVLVGGCSLFNALSGDDPDGGTDHPDAGCPGPGCEIAAEFAAHETRDVDILFVIDNSPDMGPKQDLLIAAFPDLVQHVGQLPGGLPNLKLGVISTNMGTPPHALAMCDGAGDDGVLQNTPRIGACIPPEGGARYIMDIDDGAGGRTRNYTGPIEDVFACIAKLGENGCDFERPFDALKRALDGTQGLNEGFPRGGSYLAVVFLTAEDDCSSADPTLYDPSATIGPLAEYRCTEFGVVCDGMVLPRSAGTYQACESRQDSPYMPHPETYAGFLYEQRSYAQLFVAAIAGDAEPFSVEQSGYLTLLASSCAGGPGEADPAIRIRDFINMFSSASESICDDDYRAIMNEVGEGIGKLINGSCLQGPLRDVKPAPGLQPDCVVTEVWDDGTHTDIPDCPTNPGADPCFEIVQDTLRCGPTPTQLRVAITRASDPPPLAVITAECLRP